MSIKELDLLKKNPNMLPLYNEGMSALMRSGVISFLRILGRPMMKQDCANPNVMASVAAFSAGFNECLEQLVMFRELHLDDNTHVTPIQDFGGLQAAIDKGDLTEEEANAIRNGNDKSIFKSAT